jgi:hypothetical protein
MQDRACHPLESVALEAFKRRRQLDRMGLAVELAGTHRFRGTRPPTAGRAYETVAADVLAVLHEQGRVKIDREGWYRLVRPKTLCT